jgi:hypothetical protein
MVMKFILHVACMHYDLFLNNYIIAQCQLTDDLYYALFVIGSECGVIKEI